MDDVDEGQQSAGEGEADAETNGESEKTGQSPPQTVDEVARLIDYPLLDPRINKDQAHYACLTARAYGIAAVVVRPCDADQFLNWTSASVVKVASVAGYPFGFNTTAAKLYEARDLLRRGVHQINCVLNVSQMAQRHFEYCEMELLQVRDACREKGATLKVVLHADVLDEEMKIIGCRMAKRIQADFAATTAPRDTELILKHTGFRVKAQVGGVASLDELLALHAAGFKHFETMRVAEILDAWKTPPTA
jgi:deoxyribose-phosphate aldolase